MIDAVQEIGPSEGQVADARAALMRDFETNSQRNDYLLSRLVSKYEYGENVKDVFNMRASVDRLTADSIRDAARTYLDTRRYVKVTLLPEARKCVSVIPRVAASHRHRGREVPTRASRDRRPGLCPRARRRH